MFPFGRANPPFTKASGPVLNIEVDVLARVGIGALDEGCVLGFRRGERLFGEPGAPGVAPHRPNGAEGRHVIDSEVHLYGRDAPISLENLQDAGVTLATCWACR